MVAPADDRQALLTALTTEHYGLQGSRTSVVSEIAGRSALYLTSLSSSLIALGFIGQVSRTGSAFRLFALTVIPVLFFLGLVTYFRVLQRSLEDLFYARAINRIRRYYLQLAGEDAHYFLLSGNDDAAGVFANMAVWSPGLQTFLSSSASMVGVVNAVVGGAGVGLLLSVATGFSLAVAAAGGGAFTVAVSIVLVDYERRAFKGAFARLEPQFPSP
jgi:small-conductance mechanosensitive channel